MAVKITGRMDVLHTLPSAPLEEEDQVPYSGESGGGFAPAQTRTRKPPAIQLE